MQNNWFECKVKYTKTDEISGIERKVSESFLVDALSFTEAESRIHTELEKMISGEFNVTNMKKSNIIEVHPNENGDRYFKAKVTFIDIDEASGKEKKANQYMLVQANSVHDAYTSLLECLSEMIVPYEIPSIAESPILDVFPFFSDVPEDKIVGKHPYVIVRDATEDDVKNHPDKCF